MRTVLLALVAPALLVAACSKTPDADDERPYKKGSAAKKEEPGVTIVASAVAKPAPALGEALVEEYEFGTIGWVFAPDGTVKADVRDKSGAPIKEGFAGELKVPAEGGDKIYALTPIPETTYYGTTLPAFKSDLTPVTYTVKLKDVPTTATLHIPADGSVAIVAPKVDAKIEVKPETKGPHGGVIQVVGDDRLELVADDTTKEVRVYVLDADLKPVKVGERKVTLGVVADRPEVVVLAPSPDELYVRGMWGITTDPARITIAVRVGPVVRVGVVGYHPGGHIVVVSRAPAVRVRLKTGWGAPRVKIVVGGGWYWEDDHHHHDHDDHGHGHGWGPGKGWEGKGKPGKGKGWKKGH